MSKDKKDEPFAHDIKSAAFSRLDDRPISFALSSMMGEPPRMSWLPPEIERDKDFSKTGRAIADLPAWQGTARRPTLPGISRPGVYAAVDCRSGSVKRCAAAVGAERRAVEGIHQALGACF